MCQRRVNRTYICRVRELETTVAEKDRQLELQRTQISNLKQQCALHERLQQMEQAESEAGVGMNAGAKRRRMNAGAVLNGGGGGHEGGGGGGGGGRANATLAGLLFRTPPSATSSPATSRSSFQLL